MGCRGGGRSRRSSSAVEDVDRDDGGRTLGEGLIDFLEEVDDCCCAGFDFSLSRAALRSSNLVMYP